jgi:hypothetical protein
VGRTIVKTSSKYKMASVGMNSIEQKRPLYFLHIPKTAGSSVGHWLARQFQAEQIFPPWMLDDLHLTSPEDLKQYSLFRGHFRRYLHERLGPDLRTVTILRDPVARTLSHWHHFMNDADERNHYHVHQQSFADFVADERNRPLIENFQARQLMTPPQSLESLAAGLSATDFERFQLTLRSDNDGLTLTSDRLFRSACDALDKMEVVGTTDDIHGFLNGCARKFGWPEPTPRDVPRVNMARTTLGFKVAETTFRRIVALNEVDYALYERARDMAGHPARRYSPASGAPRKANPDWHARWIESRLKLITEILERLQEETQRAREQAAWTEQEVKFVGERLDGQGQWLDAESKALRERIEAQAGWTEAEVKFVREHLDAETKALRERMEGQAGWAEAEVKFIREYLDGETKALRERIEGQAGWAEAEVKFIREYLDTIHEERQHAKWTDSTVDGLRADISRFEDQLNRLGTWAEQVQNKLVFPEARSSWQWIAPLHRLSAALRRIVGGWRRVGDMVSMARRRR